ncbi:helix-turn-helix domain-containing protein [Streptomyces buecherae]|uniref:Helix-turn-helix transcriptional regulator n=1 Tax=Streptomyces buecherae TaxID=2763006 RepID=A0A7H8NA40_9ACTN|nr:helix-turn-helix transcriptional regulator [Streptomyces buecherae]QKW51291.1 helix-turn-helix transcriptional regulator [Streptomyces buecherae]
MKNGSVGRRIAFWRERRGFTQGDFGRLMGQSRRWVQDIEGGHRHADPRLSVLQRAADVLHVPLKALLIDPSAEDTTSMPVPAEVAAILHVLDRHDLLTGALDIDRDPPSNDALQRSLTYCCQAFQACHYTAINRELPPLIVDSHRALAAAPADSVRNAQSTLSRVYQLVASFLQKFGESVVVPAAVAADRALVAAEQAQDPIAIAAASRRVAKSLSSQGRPESAQTFAVAATRRLAGDLSAQGPLGLSTLGMLFLNAATAASHQERNQHTATMASDFLEEAAELARQQGGDRDEDWTMFGPTNVGLHRVDVLVRFEDGWSALNAASDLTDAAVRSLTHERRAQHLTTMARAYLLARQKDEAANALIQAEALAPQEVHRRPETVALVRDVVGVTEFPSHSLRSLASRCGLPA